MCWRVVIHVSPPAPLPRLWDGDRTTEERFLCAEMRTTHELRVPTRPSHTLLLPTDRHPAPGDHCPSPGRAFSHDEIGHSPLGPGSKGAKTLAARPPGVISDLRAVVAS